MMPSPIHNLFCLFIWISCQANAIKFDNSPPQIVEENKEVHINCKHDDSARPVMLWYQQKKGSTSMTLIGYGFEQAPNYEGEFEQQFKLTRKSAVEGALVISKAELSLSAVYFCAASAHSQTEAYFGAGTKLTVLEKDRSVTPPTVKVIRPSPRECTNQKDKGKKKTIVCVASGFYPDHVSVLWKIDGENVTNNVATDEDAKMVGDFYRITSRLRVSREDYYSNPKKEFTCEVSFFNKTHTTYHSDGISSDEDKQTVTMTREKYLSITQSAKLSYGVLIVKSCVYGAFVCFLVWKLQGSGKPIK
ncbi:M1-specific T cell receptor beta chain-like isoform 7-T7 [Pholidichthys leucotaenia]